MLEKPTPAPLCVENIPPALKSIDQWVVWKYEVDSKGEKWTKVPYNCKTGGKAGSTIPDTWATFDQVQVAAPRYSGIGFVVTEAAGIIGGDLDHCLTDGVVAPWADEIINALDTYTEVTPSGTGLRFFALGKLPEGRRKKGDIECYQTGRFLTITGAHYGTTPQDLMPRQEQVEAFVARWLAPEVKASANGHGTHHDAVAALVSIPDDDLWRKIAASKNGASVERLYQGDWQGRYASQSEADSALCFHLAFWTNRDAGRVDNMFRSSGLMRAKWDERHHGNGESYGQRTVSEAVAKCQEAYGVAPMRALPAGNGHATLAAQAQAGAIIESIGQRPEDPDTQALPGEHLSDMGNAKRFVKLFKDDTVWVPEVGHWYAWVGTHWQQDDDLRVQRMAQDTVRSIYPEAWAATDGDVRKRIAAHALRSESAASLKAMLEVSKPLCVVRHEELDTHPFLLNCESGTIDLRSGIIGPHKREHKITLKISEKFSPEAQCPAWMRFLDEIMVGVTPRVEFLRRMAGYVLTGSTIERCLFLGEGRGTNGKSTFINALERALGPYARRTDSDTILARDQGKLSNDLARLPGARLVITSEIEDGRRLNEAIIKDITGNDTITCRFLHREFFSYRPTYKIWSSTNHRPVVRTGGQALWNRIRLIPFEACFDGAPDLGLEDKLAAEVQGILAWALRGCLEWQQVGLSTPEDVRAATASYREESDLLGQFIGECCYLDADAITQKTPLFTAWSRWAEANGVYVGSAVSLSRKMHEKGFDDERDRLNRWWVGVGLRK